MTSTAGVRAVTEFRSRRTRPIPKYNRTLRERSAIMLLLGLGRQRIHGTYSAALLICSPVRPESLEPERVDFLRQRRWNGDVRFVVQEFRF
jgi:hypothetical protein